MTKRCQAVLCVSQDPRVPSGKGRHRPGDRCEQDTLPMATYCWVHSTALKDGMLPKERQFHVPTGKGG